MLCVLLHCGFLSFIYHSNMRADDAGSTGGKKGLASASLAVGGDKAQESKTSMASGPHSAPAAGRSSL